MDRRRFLRFVPDLLATSTVAAQQPLKAGFIDKLPVSIMITGRLYDEATVCRVALAYEQATTWHEMHQR